MAKKKKKSEKVRLTEKIDSVMSLYIRLSNADKYGYCNCVTCGSRMYWKGDGMQMGHFMAKGKGASGVRFLPHNTWPQCFGCNCSGGSLYNSRMSQVSQIRYYQFMEAKFGRDIIDDLLSRKFQVTRYTVPELQEIHDLYKEFYEEELCLRGL